MPTRAYDIGPTPVDLATLAGLNTGRNYTLQNVGDSRLYVAELSGNPTAANVATVGAHVVSLGFIGLIPETGAGIWAVSPNGTRVSISDAR